MHGNYSLACTGESWKCCLAKISTWNKKIKYCCIIAEPISLVNAHTFCTCTSRGKATIPTSIRNDKLWRNYVMSVNLRIWWKLTSFLILFTVGLKRYQHCKENLGLDHSWEFSRFTNCVVLIYRYTDLDAFNDAKFKRIQGYITDHLSRDSCPLCLGTVHVILLLSHRLCTIVTHSC